MLCGTDWRRYCDFVILDFDKTITRAHTNGGVQMPAFATDEYIASNFADLKLFQWLVPFVVNQDAKLGIASFGGHQENMLLSGLPLIRKYLDVAFGPEKSKKYIPDEMIAVWHPQYDKQEDPAKVGKQKHIEYLINNAGPAPKFNNSGGGPRIKMHKCALFDDDTKNIQLATAKYVQCFYCEAVKATDKSSPTGLSESVWRDFIARKGRSSKACVIM